MKKQKKFPKLIKNNLYEIDWVDTFVFNGWFSEEDIERHAQHPAGTLTAGYYINELNGFIVLAMGRDISEEGEFLPYNTPKYIPRGYIKNIREL